MCLDLFGHNLIMTLQGCSPFSWKLFTRAGRSLHVGEGESYRSDRAVRHTGNYENRRDDGQYPTSDNSRRSIGVCLPRAGVERVQA